MAVSPPKISNLEAPKRLFQHLSWDMSLKNWPWRWKWKQLQVTITKITESKENKSTNPSTDMICPAQQVQWGQMPPCPLPSPASYGSGMWRSLPVCERGVIFQWKVYERVTLNVKNGNKREVVSPYKTLLTTPLGLFLLYLCLSCKFPVVSQGNNLDINTPCYSILRHE